METIIEKTIENITFELKLDPNTDSKSFKGSPILTIDDNAHLIYPVDLCDVLKTILRSNTLQEVAEGVKNLWCEESITNTLKEVQK